MPEEGQEISKLSPELRPNLDGFGPLHYRGLGDGAGGVGSLRLVFSIG